MSDPLDDADWAPGNRVPQDGYYQAKAHRTVLGDAPYCAGAEFGGWEGYEDSEVRWSSRPVRAHTCHHDDVVQTS